MTTKEQKLIVRLDQKVRVLRERVEVWKGIAEDTARERDIAQARAREAQERVRELEAELAKWRKVGIG